MPDGKLIRKRVLAVFLVLLASAGFLSWWNWGVPAVESRLQSALQSLLSRELGRSVRIGSVVLHPFLLHLSFNDIAVDRAVSERMIGPRAAPEFRCERILVRLTPHRLRVTHPWFAFALGNIIVEKPDIRLSREVFDARGSQKSKLLAFPLLLLQAEWRDGRFALAYRDDAPPFIIDQWGGRFLLTKQGITIETTARAVNGPLKAAGRVKDWESWEAEVRQERASLSALADKSPYPLPGALDGRADLELLLSGAWPPAPSGFRWRIKGRVQDGEYLFPGASTPLPFSGGFDWRPGRLSLNGMRIAKDIVLDGRCDKPFDPGASLDFSVNARDLDLEKIRPMLPAETFLSKLPVSGLASFDGKVAGTISEPIVAVNADISDPRISFVSFPAWKASVNATRRSVEAEIDTLRGSLAVSGKKSAASGDWGWDVQARRLDLRQWSEQNRWGNIAGSLSGRFSMSGVPPDATAEGRLEIDKVTWGVHQDTGTLSMRLSYSGDRLDIRGEGRALRVDLHRSGDRWILSQLDFNLPDGLSLAGRGEWDGGNGRMNGFVSLKNVSLRDVPMLLKRYPDIQGRFDFDGNLTGTLGVPLFRGDCRLSGLVLRKGGLVQDGRANLEWGRDAFSFTDFRLGDALAGEAGWSREGGWSLKTTLDNLDAKFVAEFFRSSETYSGRWDGDLTASGGKGAVPRARGRIVWRDGGRGGFSFRRAEAEFHVEESRFFIDNFEIRQASGSCRARGLVSMPASGGPVELAAHAQQLSLGAFSLDGEINVSGLMEGAAAFNGRVWSPSFWVNGISLGSSRANLYVDKGRVRISDVSALEGALSGAADVDLANRALSAQVAARSVDLPDAIARWSNAPTMLSSGTLSGNLTLQGPWDAVRGGLRLDWDRVLWNGVPISGSLSGEWVSPRLRVDALSMALPEGGSAAGRGEVVLSTASSIRGELSFINVPLGDTFRAVSIAPFLVGNWSGRVSCDGDLWNPLVNGDVFGENAEWKDTVFPSWSARFQFQDRQMDLQEFQARTLEGLWRLKPGSRIFFTRGGGGHLRLVQDLRNIHIGPMTLFGGLEIAGTWRADETARFEADLRAQSLWVNQHFFNQDLAHMVWSEKALVFSPLPGSLQAIAGTVRLDKLPQVALEDVTLSEEGQRRLWINGEVGPRRWDFELQGWGLEAETLIGLADLDVPLSGRIDAQIVGRGDPGKPDVEGTLLGQDGHLGLLPYDRLTAAVQWKGPFVEIRELEASRKSGYNIRGSGRIPVTDDEKLADRMSVVMRLTGGDLRLLKDIWPHCRSAEGTFHGELQLFSDDEDVRMAGYLTVENGRMTANRYFRKMTDLNARLLLQDDRLTVENISGRVGRGRLVVQGKMGLRGLAVSDFDLSARSVGPHGIEIEVPQLSVPPGPLLKKFSLLRESLEGVSSGEPLVYLTLEGTREEPFIKGTIVLDNTQFTYPPANKGALFVKSPAMRDFVSDAVWDVQFRAGNNTWYRNEFVNVQVSGALGIAGKREALAVNGRILTQRGVISYLGQTFNVKDANFEIVTDTRPAAADYAVVPYLWGAAEREMVTLDDRGVPTPDTIIMSVSRAPLGEIQPRFISRNRPNLSSERVAQMALGFQDDGSSPLGATQSSQLRDQVMRAGLVQLLGYTAGPLATRIANRFGIDMITPIYEQRDSELTDPNSTAAQIQQKRGLRDYTIGTGASLGIQLSNRIFGYYKGTVDQTQNQYFFHDELELTYRVRGNLHLRASTELDTQRLLGQPPNRQAVLENQWRFGPPKPVQKRPANQTTQEKDDSDSANTAQ